MSDLVPMKNMVDDLEEMIDANGLYNVLEAIQQVCSTKADHIAASYNDEELAEAWRNAADGMSYALRTEGAFSDL